VARLSEGFNHFVTSIVAPVASGWSGCRAGLAPAGKRRLCTAHAICRRSWQAASRQVNIISAILEAPAIEMFRTHPRLQARTLPSAPARGQAPRAA